MAVYYRTVGFVLAKKDTREADQVFSVFTKDFGKVKVLGRAIRKIKSKLRSGIDLFYLSEIEFIQGKNQKTLTDALAIEKNKNIIKDVDVFGVFQKIAETADILIKGEERDERIWNLFVETFNDFKIENLLKIGNWKLKIYYHYFFWTLVSFLGYQMDLYHCSKCGQKLVEEISNFSPEHRGIICLRCSDDAIKGKVKISPDTVKILRIIQEGKKDILNKLRVKKECLNELDEIVQRYLISF